MTKEFDRFDGRISRGRFLTLMAGTGAALASGAVAPPALAQSPVLRRALPGGETIPVVGLGTARVFDVEATPENLASRGAVLKALYAGGGTVIDTAPSYGNAEVTVGRLLADLGTRDRTWLATKVRSHGRDAGIAEMQESFQKLRTDKVELMQVHNLRDTDTQLATLAAWKKEGKIRYTGVTHFRASAQDQLAEYAASGKVDVIQVNYSIDTRDAEKRLLRVCQDKGVAVMCNLPFGRNRLFRKVRGKTLPDWAAEFDCASWGQFFLKYLLGDPAVTCVIPGTSKARHMTDNLGAARGRLPDAAMRKRMVALIESL